MQDWSQAIAAYHSEHEHLGKTYLSKVMDHLGNAAKNNNYLAMTNSNHNYKNVHKHSESSSKFATLSKLRRSSNIMVRINNQEEKNHHLEQISSNALKNFYHNHN